MYIKTIASFLPILIASLLLILSIRLLRKDNSLPLWYIWFGLQIGLVIYLVAIGQPSLPRYMSELRADKNDLKEYLEGRYLRVVELPTATAIDDKLAEKQAQVEKLKYQIADLSEHLELLKQSEQINASYQNKSGFAHLFGKYKGGSYDSMSGNETPHSSDLNFKWLEGAKTELERAVKGSAVLLAGPDVKQYAWFPVKLTLSHKSLADVLHQIKSQDTSGMLMNGTSDIKMTQRMIADIRGGDFNFESENTAQEQLVEFDKDTVWEWRAKSDEPGLHKLRARLFAISTIGDKDIPQVYEVGEVNLDVAIDELGWITHHWELLLTAIILPFIGWGFGKMPWRKNDAASS